MAKKVQVKGVIVPNQDKWIYDWFGIDATSPQDVAKEIAEANGDAIEVEINSEGGDVFAGSEIYTSLKGYPGKVTVQIVGLAASAASVVAMAGNVVQITPTGQLMIHNVWSRATGDYRDMQHAAGVLENMNKSIANAYILKTGLSQEELLDLMNKETWLNAQQAKDKGFVDEIMFDYGHQLAASAGPSTLLPPQVINKLRNHLKQPNQEQSKGLAEAQARLNFLRLKGEMTE